MKEVLNLDKTMARLRSEVDKRVEIGVKDALEDIAEFTISSSIPTVDTGAYITSFSFSVGAGRPRGKSSENRPKKADPQAMASEGLNNLLSDINSIQDFNYKDNIILRNNAPHALAVEHGGANWKYKQPYNIFTGVKDRYG